MKKFLLALGFLFLAYQPAQAQRVVTSCGTLPQAYVAGTAREVTVDTTGTLCSSATISASGGLNVTVTNTNSVPVFVTNPNGFGSTGGSQNVTVTNTNSAPVFVSALNGFGSSSGAFNVTVTNTGAIPVSEVNSAAILAALSNGVGTFLSTYPASGIAIGWNAAGVLQSISPTNTLPVGDATNLLSTPTVTTLGSYSANNCVAGAVGAAAAVNMLTVANYPGESGFLTNFLIMSANNLTPTLTVYLFDSTPSNSICTEKGSFLLDNKDLIKLIVNPSTVTLAAPGNVTSTVGQINFSPPVPFRLAVGSKVLYYLLQTTGSFSAANIITNLNIRAGTALN
jgi:hypothetical protein